MTFTMPLDLVERLATLREKADAAFRSDVSYAVEMARDGHAQASMPESWHVRRRAAAARLRAQAEAPPLSEAEEARRARRREADRQRRASMTDEERAADSARRIARRKRSRDLAE